MKKRKLTSLVLNKKSISKFDNLSKKGGTYLPSVHHNCPIEPVSSVHHWCTAECSDYCNTDFCY
jgi:hypothetical protein